MRKILFLCLIITGCMPPGTEPEAILPLPSESQLAYQEMEFNGFVHFNMNTFSNMEWGYGNESPALFDPTDLDCEQWVKTMKEAGMKGVVLTAKHHDGFCLWPSKYTEHSVKNSPWKDGKGDVVRDLADACRKYDMKFGVYLSPWDRNHKDYGRPEYLSYFRNQLTELLTNYGEIFEVWFDGANGGDGYYGGARESRKVDKLSYYKWQETYQLVYDLQPKAIIFSDAGPGCRWIGNEHGYAYETTWSMLVRDSVYGGMPEYAAQYSMGQEHGTHWVPGEADVSIRPGWYYHPYEDHKVKGLETLMDIYYKSVGQNATLLLNFPVDKRGLIHEEDVNQLQKMAAKIKEDFSQNLMLGAGAKCSNCRGKNYCADYAIDGNKETYWAAEDNVTKASLTIDLGEEKEFNRIVLQEAIALGQRVKQFRIEILQDGDWKLVSTGTTIGYKRILRLENYTARKLRLSILDARACPTINNFEIYKAPALLTPPKIKRSKKGLITMSTSEKGQVIKYTTDGSEPTLSSKEFRSGIRFPRGGLIKAISTYGEKKSEVATKNMDIGPGKWYILNAGLESQKAIDLDPETWWQGNELIIHLNENLRLNGFTYLPTQQRYPVGYVEKYSFYTSIDGKDWVLASSGEFANIRNNPIMQEVRFERVEAAYIKFVAQQTSDQEVASIAEIGLLTKS